MNDLRSNLVIRRSTLVLDRSPGRRALERKLTEEDSARVLNTPIPPPPVSAELDLSVLVVNASHEMAKEITFELGVRLPGCGIIYAPTIDLAKWVLRRRKIDLVVSSPILPDGAVSKLGAALEKLPNHPSLVVVGDAQVKEIEELRKASYHYSSRRDLRSKAQSITQSEVPKPPDLVTQTISDLGNDIRNDLNNPLQAIVAMVFVAQNSKGEDQITNQALDAIEQAARKMSGIVNKLEDKIKDAVVGLK